jgi:hypothetical protein
MEDTTRQYGQQEFNLPHDVVSLPSKGLFYKNKKKSLKIGYLTAQDENILINAANTKGIVNELVRNKLYEPDIRVEDLLEGDLEAVLIFLRNTSFGPDYTFKLRDPKTNKEFEKTIRLDELNIIEPELKPDDNGIFTLKLPKSGNTVKCKLLTIGDIEGIERILEQYPPNTTPPRVTTRLEKQIVSIDDNSDREYISKFILNLPIMDSKHIRNTLSKCEPKIDLERVVNAPSGERVNVRITFGVEFFRPFF